MIYSLLRAAAGVALRWYYTDVTITRDWLVGDGEDEFSVDRGPLLVVVNHPNALVDVLIAGRALPRRLLFTAKSTLFVNPVSRVALTWMGVVPLRRASDEKDGRVDPSRNAEVFEELSRALLDGKAVLVFPEGKSHDEPAMAPLKTGVARIALSATVDHGVRGVRILPVGLIFQRKDAPRSRVLAIVGEPLDLDSWSAQTRTGAVAELTSEIDARLRGITLNYESSAEAESVTTIARQIAALLRFDAPSVGDGGSLRRQAGVARLLLMPTVRDVMQQDDGGLGGRASTFRSDLAAFQRVLDAHHISLDDLTIDVGVRPGVRFVVREVLLLLAVGPIALWGWANHLIPFRAALAVGRRNRGSAADPAMRTIIAGVSFVMMMYLIQGALVALVAGPWWALAYVASLPVAADLNLRFRERLRRAARRARTYLFFRTRPALRASLLNDARALRDEALDIARAAGISGTP